MTDVGSSEAVPEPAGTERRAFLDWLLGLSAVGAVLAIVYPVVEFVSLR